MGVGCSDLVDPQSKAVKRDKHFKQKKKLWFLKKFDKGSSGDKDNKVSPNGNQLTLSWLLALRYLRRSSRHFFLRR